MVAAIKGVAAIKEVDAAAGAAGEVAAAGGGKIQPFLKKRATPREIG